VFCNMIYIEKASLADVPQLSALVNEAYRGESSKKGWTTEAELLDGMRIDEETLTGYIQDADTTILKYINKTGDLEACVYLKTGDCKVYIGMLTVKPELQNKGIGGVLLAKAHEFAIDNDCDVLWMTVISTRHELIAYYERKGFSLTGETREFPTDTRFGIQKQPLELIVMAKVL
jgi:ribosomal protein S18 acetylase RimI-like enzyme